MKTKKYIAKVVDGVFNTLGEANTMPTGNKANILLEQGYSILEVVEPIPSKVKLLDEKYIADIQKIQADEQKAKELEDKKAKQKILETLEVKANTVPFNADNQSINYMSCVITLANAKYNKLVSSGTTELEAYESTYKTKVPWKNADNTKSEVQLETIVEALEKAMNEIAVIKTGDL